MHLLTKSQFYSQFLLQQIEAQKNIRTRLSQDDENGSSQSYRSSQESQSTASGKRKRRGGGGGGGKRKRNDNSSYQITDVIDEDTVKRHAEGVKKPQEEMTRVAQPKLFRNGVLRSYQLDGFSWLLIPTLLYHGSESERVEKREVIRKALEIEGCPVQVLPVVITSYELQAQDNSGSTR